MRVSGNSGRNWQPARACWQGTESSRTQSGTKQGGPPHDHWAKLGQLRYTRSQYSFVAIALFSMKFIAPTSTKKELTPERRANFSSELMMMAWASATVAAESVSWPACCKTDSASIRTWVSSSTINTHAIASPEISRANSIECGMARFVPGNSWSLWRTAYARANVNIYAAVGEVRSRSNAPNCRGLRGGGVRPG